MNDTQQYIETLAQNARKASRSLCKLTDSVKSAALRNLAAAIRAGKHNLIAANAKDIEAAQSAGLAQPLIERLKLNDKRIESMATAVEQIAAQTDPVGQIIEGYNRPNGLKITKIRVPIGVVLFIYESRPNVTSDAAALCIKSGNAIILRGGKDAFHSNQAIAALIADSLKSSSIDPNAVQLIQSTDRALLPPLLKLNQYIDIVIPRGGENLIRAVVSESTIPVLKHFTGNCHIYVDQFCDESMMEKVISVCVNAKTSYPGGAVCNAVEHILFHKKVAGLFIPKVAKALADKGVEIRGDEESRKHYPPPNPPRKKTGTKNTSPSS